MLKSARLKDVEELAPAPEGAVGGGPEGVALEEPPTVIYLDARAFTRDCVGGWLRSSLGEINVLVLQNADQIETKGPASDQVQAVIINAGPERMSSATMTRLRRQLQLLGHMVKLRLRLVKWVECFCHASPPEKWTVVGG